MLAHREKIEKKRKGELGLVPALSVSDSTDLSIERGEEKRVEKVEISEVGKI